MSEGIDVIDAKAAWVTGIFRINLHIVCGECQWLYSTKKPIRATNMNDQLMAPCPRCQSWNLTELAPHDT